MITKFESWFGRSRKLRGFVCFNLIVLVLAVGTFLSIADEVREREHQGAEDRLMQALRTGDPVRPIGPAWMASAARDITGLGSSIVLTTMVGLVAGFLLLSRRGGAAFFLLAASIGGWALNIALKGLYGRDRPAEALRLVDVDSFSFPSGHAMSSATIYLTLAVLLTRLATSRIQRLYIFSAALLVSLLVGLSRIYLGVHYPSDVLAGWAVGIVWAETCWFAAQFVGGRPISGTNKSD